MGSGFRNGRGELTNSCAVAPRRGNLLRSRMSAHPARRNRRPLPLSGQGPHPGTAATRSRCGRPDPAGRPPLCHRERPERLRSRAPAWLPKTDFLMLMRNEWLAALRQPFRRRDQRPDHPQGRRRSPRRATWRRRRAAPRSSSSSRTNFADELKGPPKVLSGDGHSFSDVARRSSRSSISAASRAIETMVGCRRPSAALPRQSLCRRAGRPGTSSTCSARRSRSATARLKVVKRITRCAAVNVDPDTAVRDLEIPQTLMRRLGHNDCGIYAEVIAGGAIGVGDAIAVEQPSWCERAARTPPSCESCEAIQTLPRGIWMLRSLAMTDVSSASRRRRSGRARSAPRGRGCRCCRRS